MRSSFAAATGQKLVRTPTARQRQSQRRLLIAAVAVGFSLVSGAIGFFTAPRGSTEPEPRTGPFSYFPSQ